MSRKMDISKNPFAVDASNVPNDLQINAINLQSDTTLKIAFNEKTNLLGLYGGLPSESGQDLKLFAHK